MKRFCALLLCLCLCLGMFPVTVGAARSVALEETLAQDLKDLGLFRGVSETDFALNRAPTRVEALVMLIRVLGKESTALSATHSHPFTDVPAWANAYVGYAYENGLTKGVSDTLFGTANATCNQYLTFILRALGYDDAGGDFSWDAPTQLARTVGILPDAVHTTDFWRADVVLISYAALPAYLKNTTQTLAQKLISAGVFTLATYNSVYRADAMKMPVGKEELTAEEVYAQCAPAVFYIEVYNEAGKALASGSGFFLTADGTAVTNYHVIEGASSAKITTSDTQKTYNVSGVWDYSKEEDWAVIQIAGSGFATLPVSQQTLSGGATVYAIGSPLGLQNTISQGIVSNPVRAEGSVQFIQTTAAISHGSSGGALINASGEVVGITSATYAEGQNLNLALPLSYVMDYAKTSLTPLSNLVEKPAAGNLTAQEELDLFRRFIQENQNDTISGAPAVSASSELSSGDAWLFLMYMDTEMDTLSLRFEYQWTDGSASVTYLDIPGGGQQCIVNYFYYGSQSWDKARARCYLDAKTFDPDVQLRFSQYDGAEQDLDYYEDDATSSVELNLLMLEGIMEEFPEYFGGRTPAMFGFPSVK